MQWRVQVQARTICEAEHAVLYAHGRAPEGLHDGVLPVLHGC